MNDRVFALQADRLRRMRGESEADGKQTTHRSADSLDDE